MSMRARLAYAASAGLLLAPVGMAAALHGESAPALSRYALSTSGAAITSSGSLAASGGLILTDSGAATVTGRLDNSPSAYAQAVTAEPGTTARTLSATEGGPPAPGSQAQYPGGPAQASDNTAGSTSAAAGESSASASAQSASQPGTGSAASASEQLTVTSDASSPQATVSDDSGSVTVGPLVIGSVSGTATVSRDAAGHHANAGVVVTGANVAGTPVSIDSTGLHAAGQGTGTLPAPPAAVAAALASAGITVSVIAPVMTTDSGGALADSGALVIREATPDVTSGQTTVSSGTDITLFLGHAVATLADAEAGPEPVAPVLATPASSAAAVPARASAGSTRRPPALSVASRPAVQAVPPHTVVTVIPGAPAATAPAPSTVTAPPLTRTRPADYQLLGHRLSAPAALAGFAAWELLTLSLATLATLLLRRRHTEEKICPCP